MSETQPSFEIGLVLAGAISAGAYTGGVIDFLMEALGEWERLRAQEDAKQGNHTDEASLIAVARHRVRLRCVTGASAGGMTGGMMLGAVANRSGPVTSDPGGESGNPLFDSWVQFIDIESLLGAADLAAQPDGFPRSLLDASPLDEIARRALRMPSVVSPPPYLADPFHVQMTVTNLRGVPYRMSFDNARFYHEMLQHGDFLHFAFANQFPAGMEEVPYRLPWSELGSGKREHELTLLRQAALATGAFPVGLAPRLLGHRQGGDQDLYSERRWRVRRAFDDRQPSADQPWDTLDSKTREYLSERPVSWWKWQKVPCQWPAPRPNPYEFLCVDGGVINNEPLELARRVLTRGNRETLASDGINTDRAMILIDPFPGGEQFAPGDYAPNDDLLHVLPTLFGAMIHQLRFKPEELITAMQDDYFSRFVIAPSRTVANGGEVNGDRAIACGALGGFSGFFAREFRVHDYFLGRKNCRNFLLKHFALPADNKLFDQQYREQTRAEGKTVDKKGIECLPIIPLYGTAADPRIGDELIWPKISSDRLAKIERWLARRYDGVSDRAINSLIANSPFARILVRLARNRTRKDVNQWMMSKLTKALENHGLL